MINPKIVLDKGRVYGFCSQEYMNTGLPYVHFTKYGKKVGADFRYDDKDMIIIGMDNKIIENIFKIKGNPDIFIMENPHIFTEKWFYFNDIIHNSIKISKSLNAIGVKVYKKKGYTIISILDYKYKKYIIKDINGNNIPNYTNIIDFVLKESPINNYKLNSTDCIIGCVIASLISFTLGAMITMEVFK